MTLFNIFDFKYLKYCEMRSFSYVTRQLKLRKNSNGIIAKVALHDLDLHPEGNFFKS